MYSVFLSAMTRFDQAQIEILDTQALDPLSALTTPPRVGHSTVPANTTGPLSNVRKALD